ncbi:MAG TPA: choice-of-anchor J domain-containing protein [Chitinophagaceae bacterium]|nr:choice-of-anchor J domain-containing protein [Chitinophagaceae bacterium]
MTTITTPLFLLALSLALAGPSMAQTALPYTSGFDNASEQAGWQLFQLGVVESAKPSWRYSLTPSFSNPNSLGHEISVSATKTLTDDWFVSPEFDFSGGGTIDSLRRRFGGLGLPGVGDTIALYLLRGDPDPSKATGKILLYDYRGADYTNDNTWYKTRAIDIPAATGKSYIAFRYRNPDNGWMETWFDNLSVSGKMPSGIVPALPISLQLRYYPNPVRENLYVTSPIPVQELRLYDLGGRLVARREASDRLDMQQMPPAAYILHTLLRDGTSVYARIAKE